MDIVEEILKLDVAPILVRAEPMIHRTSRVQYLNMSKLFPNDGKICACGCGKELSGRRTRWFSDACMKVPSWVFAILRGDTQIIRRVLYARDGFKCAHCGESRDTLQEKYNKFQLSRNRDQWQEVLEVDHILEVTKGGGGCWLDNYQLLCYWCHKIKSAKGRAVILDTGSGAAPLVRPDLGDVDFGRQ